MSPAASLGIILQDGFHIWRFLSRSGFRLLSLTTIRPLPPLLQIYTQDPDCFSAWISVTEFFPLFIQRSHLINLNQFANVFIYIENPLDKQEFCDTVHTRTTTTKKKKKIPYLKKKFPDLQTPRPAQTVFSLGKRHLRVLGLMQAQRESLFIYLAESALSCWVSVAAHGLFRCVRRDLVAVCGMSLALQGRFLTTGLPGKSLRVSLLQVSLETAPLLQIVKVMINHHKQGSSAIYFPTM